MSSEKKPFLVFEFLASRNPIEKEEDYDFLWSGGRSDATSVLVELTIKYVCLTVSTVADNYYGQTNSILLHRMRRTDEFVELTSNIDGQTIR